MPRWATVQTFLIDYNGFVDRFKDLPMDNYS